MANSKVTSPGLNGGRLSRIAQCNSRRVEGVTVEYRPERSFLGADTVGLDILYPSGNERMSTYYITVK